MRYPLSALPYAASVVSLTLLYNDDESRHPAKAGIQIENTRFPRIKYGAGLSSPE